VIVIGTGAGGGTIAHPLAQSGKRILLLERGTFLTRELENWDPGPVFVDGRYISSDTWFDSDGKRFQPQVHYFVGGATKLYGAALYRLRPIDFGELWHADGVSPAWPLSYDDFEPWLRAGSCSMRPISRPATASAARRATVTRAWCTPKPTPTRSPSGPGWTCPT